VAPDPRVDVEVGLLEPVTVRVVPELDGHRRDGRGDDEFADAINGVLTVGIPRFDAGSQEPALHLACVDGQHRVAADVGRTHIRAAAGGVEPDVGLDRLVDPAPAIDRQHGA
jgi:hypothetical protein